MKSVESIGRTVAVTGLTLLAAAPGAQAKTTPKHIEKLPVLQRRVEQNTAYNMAQYVLNRTITIQTGPVDQPPAFRNVLRPVVNQRRGNHPELPTIAGLERGDFTFASIACASPGKPQATVRVFNPNTMRMSTGLGEMTSLPPPPAFEDDLLIKPFGLDPAVTSQTKQGPACYNYALNQSFDLRVDPGGAPAQIAFEYPVYK